MYIEMMDRLFVNGFLTCALWSSNDDSGTPLDINYDFDDIAPESLEQLQKDAVKFFTDNIDLINQTPEGYSYEHAGHDFWLTRNGHGAGFWDGDCEPVGDELTAKAKEFKEVDLYIGDDGKLYI